MIDINKNSLISMNNINYIEDLFQKYLINPEFVEVYWQNLFLQILDENIFQKESIQEIDNEINQTSTESKKQLDTTVLDKKSTINVDLQFEVIRLIDEYRRFGYQVADLDPLNMENINKNNSLQPNFLLMHGNVNSEIFLSKNDYFSNSDKISLTQLLENLKQTYCRHIGIEYMHLLDQQQREWIRKHFESCLSQPKFSNEQKKIFLQELTWAETLERYLHNKYVGQKRFSLEGGENVIVGLNYLIQHAAELDMKEIVLGMAHRGRLNVLINALGKSPQELFDEFEGNYSNRLISGDVKYHLGYRSEIQTQHGKIKVSLEYNPSHLESVNPVVEGVARALQDQFGKNGNKTVLPVLIHGDSALAGLGVNQAIFNMSQTRGYTTGGTIHLVINNQIGFTTSKIIDNRSSKFATDIAKMIAAPIFHVNGDDPEAICMVMKIALDYRNQYHQDVVVDIVCYRKLGHNEGDDPSITQPKMYQAIAKHPSPREIYANKLIAQKVVSDSDTRKLIEDYRDSLDNGIHIDAAKFKPVSYTPNSSNTIDKRKKTQEKEFELLSEKLTQVPDEFVLHPTVKKVLNNRKEMVKGSLKCDWGMAETLAYANLVINKVGVRISGEDSARGTFSHRHSVLHNQNTEINDFETYIPLENLSNDQAEFTVIDSILNEEAVLSFEYGYASRASDKLVIWEAQFGDFANGAQVAIDQFISSGEVKWGKTSNLTIILPHGYDGQGPEHSSARLERWLQLCADENMKIIMPSEASQMFHILCNQGLNRVKKPLIIFLSKKLLRFKDAMSPIEQIIGYNEFKRIINDDVSLQFKATIKRIILCSGQIFYDLIKGRELNGAEDKIAIIRVEQLYPYPDKEITNVLSLYPNLSEVMWVQEEPENQGAMLYMRNKIEPTLSHKLKFRFVTRPESAAPAVGYSDLHKAQLEKLIKLAFEFDH